jgi:sugar lactone lactonase YvrE
MHEALEFAGYDVKFEMGTEAHNLKQGGADLPDALRWLWRGYPEPITVHEPPAAHEAGYDTSNRVFSTLYLDKPWQQVGGEYGSITSLTADRNGNVYLPGATNKKILRVDPQGNVTPFVEVPDSAPDQNSTLILRMGPGDRLYAYVPVAGSNPFDRGLIVSWSTANEKASDRQIIAPGLRGVQDFVVMRDGTIYSLNSRFFSLGRSIVRIDLSGKSDNAYDQTDIDSDWVIPTCLALSPDQSMLVVTDEASQYSWSLQIAADGSLVNGEPFYRVELPETTMRNGQGNVCAVAEDSDGMVYFATALGIQVAMQNGRIVEILNPPITAGESIRAITFAGSAQQNWIYVAQDGKLFRRPVKVTGANAWTVVKPPKPTL